MPTRSTRTRRRRRPGRPDDGASAVEFALVLPLLLTFLFGIIQYGYGFYQLQAFNSTLTEVAQRAATGVSNCGLFRTQVVDSLLSGNGLEPGQLTTLTLSFVNPDGSAANGVGAVRGGLAQVRAIYRPIDLGLPFVPFPSTFDVRRTSTVQDVALDPDGAPLGNCR